MRTNDGSIEQNALFVELHLEMLENGLPVSPPRPQREPIVDRLPRAKTLGQISPGDAGLETVENCVDEEAVAYRWSWTTTTRKHSR
jgi:hypothetical protein